LDSCNDYGCVRTSNCSKYPETPPPTATQVGGDHYRKNAIQPIDYIRQNNLGYCEGNVVKYITRWRDKGWIDDLRKAKHYIDFLIEEAQGDAR
jgi:hypothetical protein